MLGEEGKGHDPMPLKSVGIFSWTSKSIVSGPGISAENTGITFAKECRQQKWQRKICGT